MDACRGQHHSAGERSEPITSLPWCQCGLSLGHRLLARRLPARGGYGQWAGTLTSFLPALCGPGNYTARLGGLTPLSVDHGCFFSSWGFPQTSSNPVPCPAPCTKALSGCKRPDAGCLSQGITSCRERPCVPDGVQAAVSVSADKGRETTRCCRRACLPLEGGRLAKGENFSAG